MEVDNYLSWYRSAIKASFDGDSVNEIRLNKNISDCIVRVKKACLLDKNPDDVDVFRLRSTLLLLLCCPSIRNHPAILKCEDFRSVIATLPELRESTFFSVVKGQKNYRHLVLLSWLSPDVIKGFIAEFFAANKNVTPLTLAMSLELLRALLVSLQFDRGNVKCLTDCSESFELFLKFFSSENVKGNRKAIKNSAYYFMYLMDSILLALRINVQQRIENPLADQSLTTWMNAWQGNGGQNSGCNSNAKELTLHAKELTKSLLRICQENIQAISVDLWMEWSEITLPQSLAATKSSPIHQKKQQKSIQSVICNIAFSILRIIDSDPKLSEELNISEVQELMQFLRPIASDPDYDPDRDLSLELLLSEINLQDERQAKLLGFALKKAEIFSSQEGYECITNYIGKISNNTWEEVLVQFIKHSKDSKEYTAQWHKLIVEMASRLPSETLLSIIVNHLNSGQDEILRTPEFDAQLTEVFNQLSGKNAAVSSGKHIWLCVQSGRAVVDRAVSLSVQLSGLVPVMVKALTAIPQVCQAKQQSGTSVLASTLQHHQEQLKDQERDFAALVRGLLSAGNVLPVDEALHLLIEPYLVMSSNRKVEMLTLPLDLLKGIIEIAPSAVIKPGPRIVSTILTLIHIIHATANLNGNVLTLLSLRTVATEILNVIVCDIEKHPLKFEKDISLLKQLIVGYKLHPRSVSPVSQLLGCDTSECSALEDLLLLALLSTEYIEGSDYDHDRLLCFLDMMPEELSKSEWILALLQLLPHSTENEWINAFFATHHFLSCPFMLSHVHSKHKLETPQTICTSDFHSLSQYQCALQRKFVGILSTQQIHQLHYQLVYPTLRIFQEVLYSLCLSMAEDNESHISEYRQPSAGIQYCFKCFASATMAFLCDTLTAEPYDKRFHTLNSVFKWWCHVVPVFQWYPELPCILLLKLSSALDNMVSSKKIILINNGGKNSNKSLGYNEGVNGFASDEIEQPKRNNDDEILESKSGCVTGPHHEDVQNGDRQTDSAVVNRNDSKELEIVNCNDKDAAKGTGKLLECTEENFRENVTRADDDFNGRDSSDQGVNGTISNELSGYENTIRQIKMNKFEFRKEIGELILCLAKYVPASPLAASVASKLNTLYKM